MSKNRRKILVFFFFFLLLAAVGVYQPVIQGNVVGVDNKQGLLVYDIIVLGLLAAAIIAGLAGHFTRHVEVRERMQEAPTLGNDALQKLHEYITYCTSQGMKEAEIKKTLQHYGWEEQHIENALSSLKLGRAAPSFREMFRE